MKAIVTGGGGFVGSNLALELENKGVDVLVIDDFSSGDFRNLDTFRGDVLAADVNEVNWEGLGKVDIVFHQAAITDTTIMDQKRMVYSNVEGLRKVLRYAIKNKAKLVYASSAAQYGNVPAPQREDGPLNPLNVYAFSKYIGDHVAMSAALESKLPVVGLRYFNVFGLREKYKGKSSSMIFQLAEQIRSGRRPRIFYDGEQMRDHIYVKDVVGANLAAAESSRAVVVNVGTGTATSFNRIIEVLNEVLNTNFEPDYFENPYAFYQNKTQADVSKLKKYLGFKCQYSIEDGIRDYLTLLYHLKGEDRVSSKKQAIAKD